MYKIKALWRKVWHVVSSTYYYFKYVCAHNDYNWDYEYILQLIDWKLERVKRHILIHGHAQSTKRIYKQISYCQYLIKEGFRTDPQNAALVSLLEAEYGKRTFVFQALEEGRVMLNTVYSKVDLQDTDRQRLADKEYQDLIVKSAEDHHAYQQNVRKRLARTLNTYMEGWWD